MKNDWCNRCRILTSCSVFVLLVAISSLSLPPFISPRTQLGDASSVTMSVAPNPYNTTLQQIRDKEDQLTTREHALALAGRQKASGQSTLALVYALAAVFFASLFFVHIYLDKKHQRYN